MTRNARRRGLAAFLGLALSWPGGLRAQDDAPGPQSPVVQEKTQWFVCTMLVTNRTDVYFSPGFDTEAEAKAQMERDRELDTAGQYSRIWVQSGKQTTKIYPPARPKPPLPVTTPAARPGGPLRFQNLPAVVVQPHREPGSGAYNSPLAKDAPKQFDGLAGTTWRYMNVPMELVSNGVVRQWDNHHLNERAPGTWNVTAGTLTLKMPRNGSEWVFQGKVVYHPIEWYKGGTTQGISGTVIYEGQSYEADIGLEKK